MNFKNQLLLSLLALIPLAIPALSQDHSRHSDGQDNPTSRPAAETPWEFEGAPYLLDIDIVTGKKLGPLKDQVVVDHDGRELRFSSKKSSEEFLETPEPFLEKVDALMVADQLALYPLKTCPISGEKLGSMGAPKEIIYKNRLVRLCCNGCLKKFRKDPSKQIAALNDAVIKAQVKDYPLETCVISDEELGGEMGDILDRVVGGRLVRLCCKMCVKKLDKDPLKYVAEIDAARAKRASKDKKDAPAKRDAKEGHGEHDH